MLFDQAFFFKGFVTHEAYVVYALIFFGIVKYSRERIFLFINNILNAAEE